MKTTVEGRTCVTTDSTVLSPAAITMATFWGSLLRHPHYDHPGLAKQVELGQVSPEAAGNRGLTLSDIYLAEARSNAGITEEGITIFERVLAALIEDTLRREGYVVIYHGDAPESDGLLALASGAAGFDVAKHVVFPSYLATKFSTRTSKPRVTGGPSYISSGELSLINSF